MHGLRPGATLILGVTNTVKLNDYNIFVEYEYKISLPLLPFTVKYYMIIHRPLKMQGHECRRPISRYQFRMTNEIKSIRM